VYTHKAFGIHFLTFLVTFAVMSSGLTSASSASKAFAGNFVEAFDLSIGEGIGLTALALGFITLVALVNFRGVGESVKTNVLLTCVELTGLLIVICIGAWALSGGEGDLSRLTEFHAPEGNARSFSVTAATALAFFAMVGFEDSVNMAEETKDPVRIFPRVMLAGLYVTGLIYGAGTRTGAAIRLMPSRRGGNPPRSRTRHSGSAARSRGHRSSVQARNSHSIGPYRNRAIHAALAASCTQ